MTNHIDKREQFIQERAKTDKILAETVNHLDEQMQRATNPRVKNIINNMLNDTITVIDNRRMNGFDQRA